MNRGNWDEPVTIETMKLGHYRTISTTEEAARVLTGDWPIEHGEALLDACRVCMDVLEGKKEPEAAREAFLKAAEEAGVFIRSVDGRRRP